ncbi:MAG: CRISPR-associated endonuclease Cas1, partial [Bacteroidota bacterium]
PQLGILHVDMHTKPTLSFDLIEPFRPWMDELLTKACLDRQLKKTFFTKNQYGIFLNKTGKAFIIPLFNEFLRSERTFLNQTATVKNQIYFLAGRLAQKIRTTTAD